MEIQQTFQKEYKALLASGITSWELIKLISEEDITRLTIQSKCSSRNLKCLRCIANFVCNLGLKPYEASLLLHSGFASIDSISNSSPNELLKKISQLEISLSSERLSKTNLSTVNKWIKNAKNFQSNIKVKKDSSLRYEL